MNTQTSEKLFERAQQFLVGGVNSPVRAWRAVGGQPLFITRGKGSRIIDANGNDYIDYVGSWGPLILGHGHSQVIAAIQQQLERGTSFGAPTELEVALAQRIQQALPSIDLIRFVNSGTEATMSALRVARAVTHRDKILKFDGAYHGHSDFLLAKAGSGIATFGLPDSAGVPEAAARDTLTAPYNDLDAVARIFEQNRNDIAAVIVEPVAGNMGVVPPRENFLQGLRDITRANDTLLIFDEVITGFRVAWNGAQGLYGVVPDLTCLGKIIGGGLPVGAYGGRREIMELVAPLGPVYQAGTLSGNPLAMAAGITTLDTLCGQSNAYAQLDQRAEAFANGLRDAAVEAGIRLTVNRVGSMLTAFFTDQPVTDYASAKAADTRMFARYFQAMLARGIYLPPSQFEALFISLAHSDEEILASVERAAQSLRELRKRATA